MLLLLSKLVIGSANGDPYESGADTPKEFPDEKVDPMEEDPPPPKDRDDVSGMLLIVPDVSPDPDP